MRYFTVTVNGKQYSVQVEETSSPAPIPVAAPVPVAAAPAPVQPQVAAAPAKPAASGSAGATAVKAPMPGTIVDTKVSVGDRVSARQVLCILEAMKMENEILSPSDGVIASINAPKGASVNTGDVIITLN